MQVQYWATTDTGLAREHNEDNFLVDPDLNLFIVCDGMGGHAAGEVASAMSVQIIREAVARNAHLVDELERDPSSQVAQVALLDLLSRAVSEACLRVYQAAQLDPARQGMGTTCCVLLLIGGRGFIGHVGDSRIYRARGQSVEQITEDHSLLNEMIRQGRAREGDRIPNQNAVTRAVGVREAVEVDTFWVDTRADDVFLMCSDGFSGYLDGPQHLLELLIPEDLEGSAHQCIEHALVSGGGDNITTILVQVVNPSGARSAVIDSPTMQLLRACPYFAHATPSELAQLSDIADRHGFEAGDTIVEVGRSAECLCVIVSGSVGVVGKDAGVTVLDAGDTFGETSLFGIARPQEGYETLTPTRLLVFRQEPLFDLLRQRPELGVKVLHALANQLANQVYRVPAELRYDPELWSQVSVHGDHTPAPGFLVVKDEVVAPGPARAATARENGPPATPPGRQPQQPAPQPPAQPPPQPPQQPPGQKVVRPAGKKPGSPPLQKRPLPPRPQPTPEEEDDIETMQDVSLDDLRKTVQFERVDDKFNK